MIAIATRRVPRASPLSSVSARPSALLAPWRAISTASSAMPTTRTTAGILRAVSPDSLRRGHILVDMTPLQANGQNGGAGLVAVSLVRHLSALAPELQFTLLTSSGSHAELAPLDAPNVRRRCIDLP